MQVTAGERSPAGIAPAFLFVYCGDDAEVLPPASVAGAFRDRRIDVTDTRSEPPALGPWNPGIESQVPEPLQHLCTIFRPENATTPIERARELHDVTGLPLAEFATFRPARLVLHELLVRVTADLSVTEGVRTEDLGINFRRIVARLLATRIEPHAREIDAAANALRQRLAAAIADELAPAEAAQRTGAPAPAQSGNVLSRLFRRRSVREDATTATTAAPTDEQRIATWLERARTTADPVRRAALEALARVARALLV
ncbi:MAG: hypothetical protein ACM37U_02850, partial [Gemmatimonas sp.]